MADLSRRRRFSSTIRAPCRPGLGLRWRRPVEHGNLKAEQVTEVVPEAGRVRPLARSHRRKSMLRWPGLASRNLREIERGLASGELGQALGHPGLQALIGHERRAVPLRPGQDLLR